MTSSYLVQDSERGAIFRVWAKPRASKSRVVGQRTGPDGRLTLEIALRAPPVEGAANQELLDFLGQTLGIGRGRVELLSGASSRLKVVEVRGLTAREVVEAIGL